MNEWKKVGNQAKKAREELLVLMNVSKGLPIKTVSRIEKSLKYLDDFRCEADARMAKKEKEADYSSSVFYGDRTIKHNQE